MAAPIGDPSFEVDWHTKGVLGALESPVAKQRYLADRLWPSDPTSGSRRTRVLPDGSLAYLDDDGNWYKAGENALLGGIYEGAIPGAAGAIGGLAGGPLGAIAGGVSGALASEGLEDLIYGDTAGPGDYAKAAATEGVLGAAGELAMPAVKAAGHAIGRAPVINRRALSGVDPLDVMRRQSQAAAMGIDMTLPEAAKMRSGTNLQWLMSNHPLSSAQMEGMYRQRAEQIEQATMDYLDTISAQGSPKVGEDTGLRAARDARREMVRQKNAVTKPLYDEAGRDLVDTTEVLDGIDGQLEAFAGTKIGNKLSRLSKSLHEVVEVPGVDGVPVPVKVPKERLDKVQAAYLDLKDAVGKAPPQQQAVLGPLQRQLDDLMIEQSPAYETATRTYAREVQPVNRYDESIVGRAAGLNEAQPASFGLSDQLFRAKTSSPEQVRYARDLIESQNPQAWRDLVRSNIQAQLEAQRSMLASGESGNLAGNFLRTIAGTRRQERLYEEALGTAGWRQMKQILGIMERLAAASKANSITAPAQEMLRYAKERSAGATYNPLKIPSRIAAHLDEQRFQKNFSKLYQMIWSKPSNPGEVNALLRQINDLSPDEIETNPRVLKKAAEGIARLLTYGAAAGVDDEL